MILPFSTQLNGKPTYFVEKILLSMFPIKFKHPKYGTQILKDWTDVDYRNAFLSLLNATKTDEERLIFQNKLTYMVNDFLKPKLHTIRLDAKDRWQPGTMIDFFINCRQKNMFRFAPRIPVVSVQVIDIKHTLSSDGNMPLVYVLIDDKCLGTFNFKNNLNYGELLKLAQNDGFDTVEDFFAYFNEDFEGKLIHWTDLKY